jgi:hypothetical protein
MVVNQRPYYRHVSCTGRVNVAAGIAATTGMRRKEEGRLLLQDCFRHTLFLRLFYCYFIKLHAAVKGKNTALSTKRAIRFAESPINDNNSIVFLIIISYHRI